MHTNFDRLTEEINDLQILSQKSDANGFFAQEVLRFYSIAGTLLKNSFDLDDTASVDERFLTHVLLRSLLENYFTIIYLFDDPNQTSNRYDSLQNSFKKDYSKLMNDLAKPEWQDFMNKNNSKFEQVDAKWSRLNGLPDINSMLTACRNTNNDRLSYLYPIYRITSFDTHGRSLAAIFESVFGKSCNFPAIKVRYVFEVMSEEYVCVLNSLRRAGKHAIC